jgi:hypothetical protein
MVYGMIHIPFGVWLFFPIPVVQRHIDIVPGLKMVIVPNRADFIAKSGNKSE